MSVQGNFWPISLRAGADLQSGDGTGAQYKAVQVNGTIAANNAQTLGLLQNKPRANEDATLGFFGHMKGVAGAAINAGNRVKVTTSGYLTAVASNEIPCGMAVTGAASGATLEGIFDFVNIRTSVVVSMDTGSHAIVFFT